MKFDCKQITDVMLAKRKLRICDLAEKLGCVESNIMNKRRRNNMKIGDLLEIAEALDYDMKIVFTDRETGEDMSFQIIKGREY